MEPPLNASSTQTLIDKLRRTQPWLRFVGIFCWIAMGLMLMLAGILMLVAAFGDSDDPDLKRGQMALAAILYAALSLLHVYPAILLLRAARHIRRLGTDSADIIEAVEAQRRLWKYIGIYLIVSITLGVLLVGLVVLFAIGKAMQL